MSVTHRQSQIRPLMGYARVTTVTTRQPIYKLFFLASSIDSNSSRFVMNRLNGLPQQANSPPTGGMPALPGIASYPRPEMKTAG